MPTRANALILQAGALLIVVLLAACATTTNAPRPAALDDARAALDAARASPNVTRFAPAELNAANAAYAQADAAYRRYGDNAETRSLAYLARERALAAGAAADRVAAERAQRQRDAREANEKAARDAERAEADKAARLAAERANAVPPAPSIAPPPAPAPAPPPALPGLALPRYGNESFDVVMRDLIAMRSDRGVVVTMGDILFEPDTAVLRPGGMRLLARLGALLREHSDRIVAIDGFADTGGDAAERQALADARADAVKAALVEAGVSPTRVAARGYGTAFPIASNDSPEGRARNRRVEVVIATGSSVPPRVAQASRTR